MFFSQFNNFSNKFSNKKIPNFFFALSHVASGRMNSLYKWISQWDRNKRSTRVRFHKARLLNKVFYRLRLKKRDFWVSFDHFWGEHYFLRSLGQLWKLDWALNQTIISKFNKFLHVQTFCWSYFQIFWLYGPLLEVIK